MSTSIPSWEDLKARKIVQWALAYADPVFARVRSDPAFEAAVVEQERLVARERREAMPLLDGGLGGND